MPQIKKLVFFVPFLGVYSLWLLQLDPIISNIDTFFTIDLNLLLSVIITMALCVLSSYFYIIFVTLNTDYKTISILNLFTAVSTYFILNNNARLYITAVIFIGFSISSFWLLQRLKSYLTFSPTSLLIPSMKLLGLFIVIAISIGYYFLSETHIKQNGFTIPDVLLTQLTKFTLPDIPQDSSQGSGLPKISQQDLKLLKSNPQALKQLGLTPQLIDSLNMSSNTPQKKTQESILPQELIKQAVQTQFKQIIAPYLAIFPIIIALLFFFGQHALFNLLALCLYPLTILIFWVLEKTHFTKYQVETREVKKLII